MPLKNSLRLCVFAVLLTCGCTNDSRDKKPVDSATAGLTAISTIQTDSGKFEIETSNGRAVFYDKSGKIKARGHFINGAMGSAWVNYDNNGKIISAWHFSKGKAEHQLDTADFNFHEVDMKSLHAKFYSPFKWKLYPSEDPHIVMFEKPLSDTFETNPNFSLEHTQLEPGDNLQSLAAMQLQVAREKFGRADVVSELYTKIDSCNAFERYGQFITEKGATGFLDGIIIHENDAWFFHCEAPNNQTGEFLLYQGVFQEIVESFRRE